MKGRPSRPCSGGERAAYAVLVDRYKDRDFKLAYRMTGRYGDADDLTQEAFIRAYLNLGRFDTDRSFFTWIYTIALNVVRNHLKIIRDIIDGAATWKDGRDAGSPGDENPESALGDRQEKARLQACLLGLPVENREAVVLRFYEDLSFEETEAVLRISEIAAKMRVYRGLDRLKVMMEEGKMRPFPRHHCIYT